MSKREELEKNNEAYKNALEKQLDKLKGDVNNIGKSALWIGGGLFATYLVVDALTAKRKKKKAKNKAKKAEVVEVVEKPAKDNLLMSTVKEQALIFLLGVAAQQLAKFLSELDSEQAEDGEKDS